MFPVYFLGLGLDTYGLGLSIGLDIHGLGLGGSGIDSLSALSHFIFCVLC